MNQLFLASFVTAIAFLLRWIFPGSEDSQVQYAILPLLPVLAGGAASIVGGVLANQAIGDATDRANALYQQGVRDLEAIGIPSITAQQIVAEELKNQGNWTPEMDAIVKLGESKLTGISTDPTYRAAQLQALSQLQKLGEEGGMTLTERANLERGLSDIAAQQRGQREAILQAARQRGGYGSGTALAAQLMAQQAGAQQASQLGLDINAAAQRRALEAIQQAGTMGGQLRGQEFSEQEKIARAQDEIARWNAANQQNIQSQNVALRNQAAQYNLANQQRIAEANVAARNAAREYNARLLQQQYQNQINRQQLINAARGGQAQGIIGQGQQTAGMWTGIGSGLANIGAAAGQMISMNQLANQKGPQAGLSSMGRMTSSMPSTTTRIPKISDLELQDTEDQYQTASNRPGGYMPRLQPY